MRPTTLYRFYDAEGGLLYIGVTSVGPSRWSDHELHREWWALVARSTVEHFPDRQPALDAERAAIILERPPHNTVHKGVKRPKPVRTKSPHGRGGINVNPDGRWRVSLAIDGKRVQYTVRDRDNAELILAALIGRNLPESDRRRVVEILGGRLPTPQEAA